METTSMKPHNNLSFPLNPSHTKNFLIVAAVAANGIYHNHYHNIQDTTAKLSDIEMVSLQAAAYTSLKDLLPTSPPLVVSPTTTSARKDSWREIPIKDPLVQHAAWAYLQPVGAAQQSDNRNLVEKLKERCCGMFGCFNDVFLAIKKGWCSESETNSEVNDGDEEEDKVD